MYDPYDPAVQENPYPAYRRLRDEAPAYWNSDRQFWALSRFEDVWTAVHDHDRFSSAQGIVVGQDLFNSADAAKAMPMMILMDPPRHDHLRRAVSRAFTPRAIGELERSVRVIAEELLDAMPDDGGDFVELYAGQLPITVIASMLGVPVEERDQFRAWSDDLVRINPDDDDTIQRGLASAASLFRYFRPLIEARRQQPRDDLLSTLVASEVDGEPMTMDEMIGTCFLLLTAGNETTTNLIANMAAVLAEREDLRHRLASDAALLPAAVEEILRLESPVQGLARTLTEDVTMHGAAMSEGDKVLLLYGSANRDPREFPQADDLVLDRRSERALAFGHGIHYCLGAALARLECRVAYESLLARWPDFEIGPGAERVRSGPVRGFERLPIAFDVAP